MLNENESRITLNEAARIAPGRPHMATVYRWCFEGCRGVRLEYERVGRRIYTSQEALRRFIERMTALDDERRVEDEPVKPRKPRQREAAVSRADRDLASAGW
jgi:hypothetical protein